MDITFHHYNQVVHIRNESVSYVMEIVDGRYLVHRYFGESIRKYRGAGVPYYFKRGYNTEHDSTVENVSFDNFPFEYPIRGHGDYRIPALGITQETGIEFIDLKFKQWRVLKNKPEINGLPSTFADEKDAKTLEVLCEDQNAGVRVYLYYTIFEDKGVIARHQKIENIGKQQLRLQNVQSLSLELPPAEYECLTLYGTHAKEGNCDRFPLHHGIQKIESTRGSSSPQHQPFMAIMEPKTAENTGSIYAVHLVYSGNFQAQIEKDQFGNIRTQIGIHSDTFCWNLEPGNVLETPEAILNFSAHGFYGMRQNFHWLYRYHLMPARFVNRIRPVLLNSWEAMYYDVSMKKIEEQAQIAKGLGVELFVLDDGWFRAGNDSRTSMGDWECNENKLAGGIKRVAKKVHEKGMQFGLWFEPEAISEDSNLYQQHPEWVMQIPGYEKTKGRHEYLLDLSRSDVRNYLFSILNSYLADGNLDYIKWDMNRPLTDVNSLVLVRDQKGEICHRYVLGLYELLGRVTTAYPNVLIEGCSSGGARFDPGMLYYVPQNWTSDNTDAYDRTQIQYGYSLLYPQIAMGAHVSITPNHQTGRSTSLDTRYQVARLFNLGYELDLTKCSDLEKEEIAFQISEHKREREWVQNGKLLYNQVPNENYTAWSVVSENKDECILIIVQKLCDPMLSHGKVKMYQLNPRFDYMDKATGKTYGGDELMQIGISVPLVKADYHTFSFYFTKITGE